MPSKLRTIKKDRVVFFKGKKVKVPKTQWEGSGIYYRRNKRWFKYSEALDRKKFKKGAREKVGTGPYRHRHDSRILK